jgi:carbonic anhydrase
MNIQDIKKRLIDGNHQYMQDDENLKSSAELRSSLTTGQNPFAIILSCADSRVVPEMIFDCNIGELFVVRVAGNIANSSSIASIEYAVAHLNCSLIVVLGHESCGAVTAAIQGGDNGKNLNHLCSHIEPAVKSADSSDVNTVVKVNARTNAQMLSENSEIINAAIKNNTLEIIPAYYHLGEGKVDFL